MPAFYAGRKRVHFAGHMHHIGLYPGVEAVEKFKAQLPGYPTTKGGIQLPFDYV